MHRCGAFDAKDATGPIGIDEMLERVYPTAVDQHERKHACQVMCLNSIYSLVITKLQITQ